jgi:hypothetical protein
MEKLKKGPKKKKRIYEVHSILYIFCFILSDMLFVQFLHNNDNVSTIFFKKKKTNK